MRKSLLPPSAICGGVVAKERVTVEIQVRKSKHSKQDDEKSDAASVHIHDATTRVARRKLSSRMALGFIVDSVGNMLQLTY